MSLQRLLLAATVLLAPAAALAQAPAQPVSGVYIAGGAGVNFLQDRDMDAIRANRDFVQSFGASRDGRVGHDVGWVGLGSVGYGFGNGLRLELEGNYRQNEADSIRGYGGGNLTNRFNRVDGKVRQYGAMFNVLYDFAIPNFPLQPYVGAGVGYAWSEYNNIRGTRAAPGGDTVTFQDVDGHIAYQAILGAAYPIQAVPGLAVTAEYRYFGSPNQRQSGRFSDTAGRTVSQGNFDGGTLNNHSLLVGLRYAFNQPRPAPVAVAPVPALAPTARTYLVFFDWDRSDLTDRARQILAEAAQSASGNGTTRIEVAGHTDRSGTPQYNQRLSQRRAEVVAAELARQGVARSSMVIQAFGESRPLVQTADGVREPQNRRVEILLR
ncbi:OmpA family protein [Roseomonas sp. BN140053]|uniref:OmpA family protein n=1 Tax=Roseomonas sp. BN140053 TaxID=3391898 RepID=UPI0039E771A8